MVPSRARWWRLAAYMLVVAAGALGFWRIETTVNRIDQVITDGDARRCINAWESRAQIREAISIPGEALIEVLPEADPEVVAQFRGAVDARIRATYPNPDCDIDAARRTLAEP